MSKFRTKYNHRHVGISFEGVQSLTDQQFKDDCSIEGIVKRYGILPPPNIPCIDADVSDIGDFAECMEKVQAGLDHFNDLPSDIRKRFGNDPKAFFAWINNPENVAEAVRTGLMTERKDEESIGEKLDRIAEAVTPKGE